MTWTREQLEKEVIQLIKNVPSDWDADELEIDADTQLIQDLGLSSLDIMHLSASITMVVQRRLPYDQLLSPGGVPISDVTVGALIDFVETHLKQDYSEDAAVIRR
ncbi:MAG: acyl carrier protein [Leptolyngbyaceae cyanobacterium]